MNDQASRNFRVAVITALVQRSQSSMGRTALMKLIYFLQNLQKVPLGYAFRLYTYGPYEAQVLEDLKFAEIQGAVKSTLVRYPTGYGYEIETAECADVVIERNRCDLAAHQAALDQVIADFGGRTAIDLEMAGTIVYVDQTSQISGETLSLSDITSQVHAIKPRLSVARIESETKKLLEKGLIRAVH
jgi:uncharacterized protein YwgA